MNQQSQLESSLQAQLLKDQKRKPKDKKDYVRESLPDELTRFQKKAIDKQYKKPPKGYYFLTNTAEEAYYNQVRKLIEKFSNISPEKIQFSLRKKIRTMLTIAIYNLKLINISDEQICEILGIEQKFLKRLCSGALREYKETLRYLIEEEWRKQIDRHYLYLRKIWGRVNKGDIEAIRTAVSTIEQNLMKLLGTEKPQELRFGLTEDAKKEAQERIKAILTQKIEEAKLEERKRISNDK